MDSRHHLNPELADLLQPSMASQELRQASRLRLSPVLRSLPDLLRRLLVRRLHDQLELQRLVSSGVQDSRPGVFFVSDRSDCVDFRGESASD